MIVGLFIIVCVIYCFYLSLKNSKLKSELNYKTMKEEIAFYKEEVKQMSEEDIYFELLKITQSDKFKSLWDRAIKMYNDNNPGKIVVKASEYYKLIKDRGVSMYPNYISDSDELVRLGLWQYMAMIDMNYTCRYLALLNVELDDYPLI